MLQCGDGCLFLSGSRGGAHTRVVESLGLGGAQTGRTTLLEIRGFYEYSIWP